MRPIFNPNLASIKGSKVWRKRNKIKLEKSAVPNRELEDITKATLFSIANVDKRTGSLEAIKVLDRLIKQYNIQRKVFPFHFVILPTGRIFQCCRLDCYIENNYFDSDSLGVALLTRDDLVIPRMTRMSIANMYNFWRNDLKWIIPSPKWKHSALVYEKGGTTEFFEKIWEQCVDEKKGYIEVAELKTLLKTLFFRKQITVRNES